MWNQNNPNWYYKTYAMSAESCWAAVYPQRGTYSIWKGNKCIETGVGDSVDELKRLAENAAVEHGFVQ